MGNHWKIYGVSSFQCKLKFEYAHYRILSIKFYKYGGFSIATFGFWGGGPGWADLRGALLYSTLQLWKGRENFQKYSFEPWMLDGFGIDLGVLFHL